MKNIFKIVILLLSFSALAQNEADLPDGVGFPNATTVTTTTATDKVAVFGTDNNSNRLISIDDLFLEFEQGLDGFIPITGTTSGNPVTGDIEFDASGSGGKWLIFNDTNYFGEQFRIGWSEDEEMNEIRTSSSISITNQLSQPIAFFDLLNQGINLNAETVITSSGTNVSVLNINTDNVGSNRGVVGSHYYGANYDDNTYVQKLYVDDAISAAFPAPYFNTFSHVINQNTTEDITINGSFFNPTTTVAITGQTVNSVTFISDNELLVNVTSGTVDGFYDVTIDNGTATTLTNAFEVKLFTILVPGDGTTSWVRNTNSLTTLGKLTPTVTTSGWNKGASFGVVPANTDFILEFNPAYMAGQTAGGYAMIGMDNADPNWNYNTIDYALYLQNGTNLYVYENAVSKGLFGNWTTSDTLAIRRTGTLIEYLKNGNVVYTSATPNSSAMSFDNSLYRYLGAENIKITHE